MLQQLKPLRILAMRGDTKRKVSKQLMSEAQRQLINLFIISSPRFGRMRDGLYGSPNLVI